MGILDQYPELALGESDKNDALNMGLLQAGLGILANNTSRNAMPAIAKGGMMGLQGYQQSIDRAQAKKLEELKLRDIMEKFKQQKKLEELQQRIASGDMTTEQATRALMAAPGMMEPALRMMSSREDKEAQRLFLQQQQQEKLSAQRELANERMAAQRDMQAERLGARRDMAQLAASLKPSPNTEKPLTAGQRVKFEADMSKDYAAVDSALKNASDFATKAKMVRESKGLEGATGVQAYIPSIPGGDAAEAENRLKALEGATTALGKAVAASSGAIGPIATQEWGILRDQVAAIDPKKGKATMLEQIGMAEQYAANLADRMRGAYEKQYGAYFDKYPQFSEFGGATPAAPNVNLQDAARAELARRRGGK